MIRIALIIGAVVVATPAFAEPEPTDPESTPAPDEQPQTKDPELAKKWLQAGDQLIRKGDQLAKAGKPEAKTQYDNAVTAYQKAIEASDDLTILAALANALDKGGNTPDAVKQLKRLIAAPNIKPDIVKNAQAKLDELAMKVAIITLQITPEGTKVSLAGEPVGEAPLTEPLVLLPGTHKLSLTAVGFQAKDVELKVEAGSESERKLALDPVPVVAKPTVEEVLEKPVDTPRGPSLVPIYIGGGATVGLTLILTVTGIIAVSEHSTFTDPKSTAAERSDAQSSGRAFAHVTDFCLVGAIGAAAFTTYWYMYKYKPQARAFAEHPGEPTTAKVDVAPWVQPQAGGVIVAGSF